MVFEVGRGGYSDWSDAGQTVLKQPILACAPAEYKHLAYRNGSDMVLGLALKLVIAVIWMLISAV